MSSQHGSENHTAYSCSHSLHQTLHLRTPVNHCWVHNAAPLASAQPFHLLADHHWFSPQLLRMLADWSPGLQVYRGLLRGVQVVAVKVFNDGPQYTSDSSQERLQTLQVLKQQRETLIRQEIAVLKSCRDHNIVQFVGACIQVGVLTHCFVDCQASPSSCTCPTLSSGG